MKYKINKCKNHVNISEGITSTNPGGMWVYGLQLEGVKYLLRFPKLFWHQVICPDNPILQKLSNLIYERYPADVYKRDESEKQEQIVITKKKIETLVP